MDLSLASDAAFTTLSYAASYMPTTGRQQEGFMAQHLPFWVDAWPEVEAILVPLQHCRLILELDHLDDLAGSASLTSRGLPQMPRITVEAIIICCLKQPYYNI